MVHAKRNKNTRRQTDKSEQQFLALENGINTAHGDLDIYLCLLNLDQQRANEVSGNGTHDRFLHILLISLQYRRQVPFSDLSSDISDLGFVKSRAFGVRDGKINDHAFETGAVAFKASFAEDGDFAAFVVADGTDDLFRGFNDPVGPKVKYGLAELADPG